MEQDAPAAPEPNAMNELQELVNSARWDAPVFTPLPTVGDQQYQFACTLAVAGGEARSSTGEIMGKKKEAQKSAAAAMLASLAAELAPHMAQQQLAPDYQVPLRAGAHPEQASCLVSALNMLCQGKGWRIPE
jgi:hypothetical protein